MTRSRMLLLAGAVGLLAIAVSVMDGPRASAHPELLSTEPPAGGTLVPGAAPVLRFASPVVLVGSQLNLVDGAGDITPLTPLGHIGGDTRSLTAAPRTGLTAGPSTLRWRALAEDGHREEGTLALVVGGPVLHAAAAAGPAPAGAAAPAGTAWVDDLFTATRSLGYLSMTVLCGGLAFLALAWPDGAGVTRVRRLLWAAWATGVITSIAGAGLQAAYAGHLGLGAALDSSVVLPSFDTRVGLAWASRGLLFVLAIPVLAGLAGGSPMVRSLSWRVGAGAVAVGLLRTPGLTGHSTEARWGWLGSIADMAHLIGVAVWLGGLVLLCSVVLPRRQPDELRQVISRFSTMAGTSVAVVVVAGSFLSWQLVGSFGALTGTRYGHVLFVKLALVATIAAAALVSHRWAASRLEVALGGAQGADGGTVALRPFVLSVATEVVLAVAVLTVASVLVASSPGR